MPLKNILINTLKLAISGAIIASIAALFLIFSEDGTIQQAEADLTDILPGGPDDHFRFERIIKRAGLEASPFDHNGNIIKFAVGESELSPKELMAYFQKEFKREGINSQVYTDSLVHLSDSEEAAKAKALGQRNIEQNQAMLQGEVVPIFVHDDMVSMGSFIPKIKVDGFEEIADMWLRSADGSISLDANHGGFRAIEARRDAKTGRSTVTATWSERDFDVNKAHGTARVGTSPDTEVPVCPGCKRLNRIKGMSDDNPYTLNQVLSRGSIDNNHHFYSTALTQRGWVESDTHKALSEMSRHIPELANLWRHGSFASFKSPNGENMNLFISDYGDGRTSVVTIQGPEEE